MNRIVHDYAILKLYLYTRLPIRIYYKQFSKLAKIKNCLYLRYRNKLFYFTVAYYTPRGQCCSIRKNPMGIYVGTYFTRNQKINIPE